MHVDFDRHIGPVPSKGINVPLNYATAYSVFALRCIIGPDIPNNAGSLAPFRVTGPKDCILNAQPPAPVAMRHTLGQMTPDLVYGCLSQALPDRVPAEGASCMYDLPLRHAPEAVSTGRRAVRARTGVQRRHRGAARPGRACRQPPFRRASGASQVETTEAGRAGSDYPTRAQARQRRARAHTRRAGSASSKCDPSNEQDFMLFLSVERVLNPATGRHGGQAGAPGRIRIGADGAGPARQR